MVDLDSTADQRTDPHRDHRVGHSHCHDDLLCAQVTFTPYAQFVIVPAPPLLATPASVLRSWVAWVGIYCVGSPGIRFLERVSPAAANLRWALGLMLILGRVSLARLETVPKSGLSTHRCRVTGLMFTWLARRFGWMSADCSKSREADTKVSADGHEIPQVDGQQMSGLCRSEIGKGLGRRTAKFRVLSTVKVFECSFGAYGA